LLESMRKRIDLIDEKSLSALSRKVKILQSDLETLQKSRLKVGKQKLACTDDDAINESLVKLERCDAIAGTIEPLIARLKSLKVVHEENAKVHSRISVMERSQKDLESILEQDRVLLQNIKEGMKENLETISNNISFLKEKI